jgi:putative hemolysin
MKLLFAALVTASALLFSGCGSPGGAPGPVSASVPGAPLSSAQAALPDGADASSAAAAAYCTQTHGEVEIRRPVYGSNGSKLLFLAGKRSFCQYTSKKDGSRIHILLTTLYTTKPSLAALAYILAPPTGSCQGNPASCYCTLLGGSDQFGGTSGAGGGWYEKKGVDQTLETCIFPDMSSIDSWGLTYHANGIVRGINLEKVMRYKYPGKT